VIELWGNITGIWTTISIGLLQPAPKESRLLEGVWLTANAALTIDNMIVSTIDLTIRFVDSSSQGQCDDNG
jgi:hypothetical protein